MADEKPDLSPMKMATVRDENMNRNFQEGFNEARGAKGLRYVLSVECFFEGIRMIHKDFTGALDQVLPDAMALAATHLLHGDQASVKVSVRYENDVPGTEIETVDAEVVDDKD